MSPLTWPQGEAALGATAAKAATGEEGVPGAVGPLPLKPCVPGAGATGLGAAKAVEGGGCALEEPKRGWLVGKAGGGAG